MTTIMGGFHMEKEKLTDVLNIINGLLFISTVILESCVKNIFSHIIIFALFIVSIIVIYKIRKKYNIRFEEFDTYKKEL